MRRPLLAAAVFSFLFAMPRGAWAIGQSVGRVTGVVTEAQTEAPVPGATLTLQGGAGVHKIVTSGEDGAYEIGDVPPGTYDLVVSYTGLKPVKRRVVVRPDEATPVLIAWTAEADSTETTVVEEERHLTAPDSPQAGMIFSAEFTNQLPLARRYQAIFDQVPGITVGTANPNVKGATFRSNRFLLNGLDVTDPVSNTFAATFPQDALESVQAVTGGFEAKYNALGAVISVQTKRGTNEYHGAASAYWSPSELADVASFGAPIYDGARNWDYSVVRPNQARYELNVTAQGPLVKDHLFFNAGVTYQERNAVQPAGPPRFVQAPNVASRTVFVVAGVSYAPVDAHRFHAEVTADPNTTDFETSDTAGSAGTPGANNAEPRALRGRSQGGYRLTTEWAWQASKHVATKVMFGVNENYLDISPQGLRGMAPSALSSGPWAWDAPQHINQDDSSYFINDANRYRTTRRRYQLDGSVTLQGEAAGKHEAELGLQTAFFENREQVANTGGILFGPEARDGWGLRYSDRGGGSLANGLCDVDPAVNPGAAQGQFTGNGCFQRTISRNYVAHQSGNTLGLYMQDRWKPSRWLTVLAGVRADVGAIHVTDAPMSSQAFGIGPRLSAIADVTGDQKTIAQVSYGRMTEMPYLLAAANFDATRRGVQTVERYDAAARRFTYLQTVGGEGSVRFAGGRDAPTADEMLLSLRREILKGTTLRVDYTYRHFQNMFTAREVNAVMDPTGTRTVGFVDGQPRRLTEYGYYPQATNSYSGVDFVLESRVKNFEFQGGYTMSWSWGPGMEPGATGTAWENPRFSAFYTGYQPTTDCRHQIKTATTYRFLGASVGLILDWRSGLALRRSYSSAETGYSVQRAPVGFDPGAYFNTGTANPGQNGAYSDVRSWTELRAPDFLTCNLMVSYDFSELLKQKIVVNVQIDNVLQQTTPASVNQTEGAPMTSQFAFASTRQVFRALTLGLRYEF